ncbi:histone-lysine N-methyltransferase SMYD3 [Electrophorus electricus]|uniref:[histone H3]-lysine(4) N-trimethyltransferase n=1 Tax=Electrophorus electricus TaxID=8005 RepID=A0A4W4FWA7_ELEEL|nr:histone-lysine N-methyltransferase SMYD3 [Electrophorus electricus]
MAKKTERFSSAGRGNGLRALLEIKTGELIHSCEPYAFCIAKNSLKSTCQSCLSRGDGLLRCSQCKCTRYCSTQCQRQAWPEHKRECKCLKHLQPRVPTDSVRLAARIIFRLLSDPEPHPEESYPLAEHQSHLEDMSAEKRGGLTQLCSMLQLYLLQEVCDVSVLPGGLDLMGLLSRVTCNCFSISDGELQDIGVGLYPSMSLLNHDCQPNCVMVFVGKRLQLRAIRNIQPHEELTISYTDVLAPGQERQAHLQQQYHFLCQCQRCNREDSDSHMLAGDKTAWMIIRDALPHLEHLRTEHQWEELQKESQILLARHAHAVPDTNVYLLRLLDMAMDACISLDQYEAALEYGNRTLGPYRLHYAEPHPSWAVELFRVGKLQHYLGRLEEASNSFTQAYDVMKVTHGTEHPLFNEVSRKLTEVQAELRRT